MTDLATPGAVALKFKTSRPAPHSKHDEHHVVAKEGAPACQIFRPDMSVGGLLICNAQERVLGPALLTNQAHSVGTCVFGCRHNLSAENSNWQALPPQAEDVGPTCMFLGEDSELHADEKFAVV